MNGKFACLIVVASVFVTGLVGYLANADVETDERQIYEYSANLVPSVVSSDVEQYAQYNPTDNVTGWQWNEPGNISNAKVPTTDTASPYVLTARTMSYYNDTIDVILSAYVSSANPNWRSWGADACIDVSTYQAEGEIVEHGYVYFDYRREDGQDNIYSLLVQSVTGNNDYGPIIEGGYYVGGYSSTQTYSDEIYNLSTRVSIKVDEFTTNTLTSSDSTPLYVVPMKMLNLDLINTQDVILMDGSMVLVADSADDIGWANEYQYWNTSPNEHFTMTWGAVNTTIVFDGNQHNRGLMYNSDTQSWRICEKNANGLWYIVSDSPAYPNDKLVVVASGDGRAPVSFDMKRANVIQATYADNTRFTQVGVLDTSTFGDTAVWRNNNSNGAITFLAKLNSDTGNLNITTRHKESDDTYTVNGQWVAYANGIVTPTGYVMITLDNINGQYTYSPVTSIEYVTVRETIGGVPTDVQYANPNTAVVSNYSLNLGVVQSSDGSDMNEMDLRYALLTGEAYVTNTVIQLDPDGRMWSNPSIYLQVYFPDNFDADDTPRVWFNGFVATGNALIINGQTYIVNDGRITVGTTSVELKGMAVDWEKANDGNVHVYISPKGVYENRIDIGVLNTEDVAVDLKMGGTVQTVHTQKGYVISTEGVWYFEVGLYDGTTEEYNKINLNLTKGWGLSVKGACLLFCGCMIFLTAAGAYYVKDNQPDLTDWLITVIVIVVTIAIAGLIG